MPRHFLLTASSVPIQTLLWCADFFVAALLLPAFFEIWNSWYAVLWALIIYGPVLLITVFLHELGHCLATRQVPALSASSLLHLCAPAVGHALPSSISLTLTTRLFLWSR